MLELHNRIKDTLSDARDEARSKLDTLGDRGAAGAYLFELLSQAYDEGERDFTVEQSLATGTQATFYALRDLAGTIRPLLGRVAEGAYKLTPKEAAALDVARVLVDLLNSLLDEEKVKPAA